MNIFKTTPTSFFCFDEAAAGTGGTSTGAAGTTSATSSAPEPGAAATPSSSPAPGGGAAPAPGSDPAASAAPASDPFSGLSEDFDSDLDEVILPDTPSTDGGAPAPPTAKAALAVAPAAAAPAAPPVAPVAAATQEDPNATSASPRARLDTAVEGFKTNSAALAEWAGNELFKLSDEDATALATNAETVIPKLMGRVYTQALAAAGNLIRNFTPDLIEHAIEQQHSQRTKSAEAVSEFYKANPDLNEKDHGQLVNQWAKAFRAANPKATRAEAIAYVSKAVRIQAGVAMPAAQPAARVAAFTPARPGGRSPVAPGGVDPYAGLDQDFDEL